MQRQEAFMCADGGRESRSENGDPETGELHDGQVCGILGA
jgi:hypothetical protein